MYTSSPHDHITITVANGGIALWFSGVLHVKHFPSDSCTYIIITAVACNNLNSCALYNGGIAVFHHHTNAREFTFTMKCMESSFSLGTRFLPSQKSKEKSGNEWMWMTAHYCTTSSSCTTPYVTTRKIFWLLYMACLIQIGVANLNIVTTVVWHKNSLTVLYCCIHAQLMRPVMGQN